MAVPDMDKLRKFAKEVYRAVDGRECPVSIDAEQFGVPADFVERAITYWVGEGVMERMGLGTSEVCLTHEGAVAIQSWS
jgi:hypothetical protein